MCRMYCSGQVLLSPEKIRADIAALQAIQPVAGKVSRLILEDWVALFTMYTDTEKTIRVLSETFAREHLWTIFRAECIWLTRVVRDAGRGFLNLLPASLEKLKGRYASCLKRPEGDQADQL